MYINKQNKWNSVFLALPCDECDFFEQAMECERQKDNVFERLMANGSTGMKRKKGTFAGENDRNQQLRKIRKEGRRFGPQNGAVSLDVQQSNVLQRVPFDAIDMCGDSDSEKNGFDSVEHVTEEERDRLDTDRDGKLELEKSSERKNSSQKGCVSSFRDALERRFREVRAETQKGIVSRYPQHSGGKNSTMECTLEGKNETKYERGVEMLVTKTLESDITQAKSDHLKAMNELKTNELDAVVLPHDKPVEESSVEKSSSCGLGSVLLKGIQNRHKVGISAEHRLDSGFTTKTGRKIAIDADVFAKRIALLDEIEQQHSVNDSIKASSTFLQNGPEVAHKQYTGEDTIVNKCTRSESISQDNPTSSTLAMTNAYDSGVVPTESLQVCPTRFGEEGLKSFTHQAGNLNGSEAISQIGYGRKLRVETASSEKSRIMLRSQCVDTSIEAGPSPVKFDDSIARNGLNCNADGERGMSYSDGSVLKPIIKDSSIGRFSHGTSTTLFMTGRGRNVTVTTKSLEKSRFIMEDAEKNVASSTETPKTGGADKLVDTGMGRKDGISADNRESSFVNIANGTRKPTILSVKIPELNQVDTLFATGSGRKVVISAESLERSRARMENSLNEVAIPPTIRPELDQVDTLFATGSGRKVVISAESMERSRARMENGETDMGSALVEKPVSNQVDTLFATGSGRKVVISAESLESSRLEFRTFDKSASLIQNQVDTLITQKATRSSNDNTLLIQDTETTESRQTVVQASVSSIRKGWQSDSVCNYWTPHKNGVCSYTISPTDRKIVFSQSTEQQIGNTLPHTPATLHINFQLKRPSECKKANFGDLKKLSKRFKAPTQQKNQSDVKIACKAVAKPKRQPASKSTQLSDLPYRIQHKHRLQKLALQASSTPQPSSSTVERIQLLRSVEADRSINVIFESCDTETDDSCIFRVRRQWTDVYEKTDFVGPKEIFQLMVEKRWLLDSVDLYRWFCNQYRWIVFLCAQMELAFPQHLCGKYLTLVQIIFQMHQRYKREVYNCQRPILRKILNGDASPSNCLVLLVAAVLPSGSGEVETDDTGVDRLTLVLTDGWYAIYAVPDELLGVPLRRLHQKADLLGKKIIMWNADLQCGGEGSEPLENELHQIDSAWKNPFSVAGSTAEHKKAFYILRYNSTRLGSYGLSLGPEYFGSRDQKAKRKSKISNWLLSSIPLPSLQVGGGIVRSIRIFVTHISPLLHMQIKEGAIGPRVLTDCQLAPFREIRWELSQLDEDRNEKAALPTPFIQLRGLCSHYKRQPNQTTDCVASLTVWRPTEDILQKVVEGNEYFVTNVAVNWKNDSHSRDTGFLKLSTTKRSAFEIITDGDEYARTHTLQTCKLIREIKVTPANAQLATVCVVVIFAGEPVEENSKTLQGGLIQRTYRQHIFVTDSSCEIASVRVSSTSVMTGSKSASTEANPRCRLSSTQWFRRARNCWQERKVLYIKGLQISHRDNQLHLLDCELCDFTEVCLNPTGPSSPHRHMARLKSLVSMDNRRGKLFQTQLVRMTQYIEQVVFHKNVRSTSALMDNSRVLRVRVLKLFQYRPPLEDHLKQNLHGCAYVIPSDWNGMASSISLLYFGESQLRELFVITGGCERTDRLEASNLDTIFRKMRRSEGNTMLLVRMCTRPYLQNECRLFPWQRNLDINVVDKTFWAHFLDFEDLDGMD
uniref:Uncharacterized protein AlNc14C335G10729 n=1 Tax=Albugo laibachii Nc14 TaxID=890382 RepID=F0WWW8_9STRA|nr:conserved hypothetical protein [Albugo laibachii Nc14]|eukprot:CCA25953.1 conserved hypothetical protein [Albugo laibachii Nc14]